jgi:dienelactone hydrolase
MLQNLPKTNLKSIISLFFLVILLSSCEKTEPTIVRDFDDIRQTFSEIDIQPGINDLEMEAYTGVIWRFRIIAPDNPNGDLKPCVIALHEDLGGSMSAHQQTSCYVEEGLIELDPYIISPNGGFVGWESPPNQEIVVGLIRLAREYLPVDTSKVMVMGFGEGGNAAWYYAETQARWTKSAMPIASRYNTLDEDGNAIKFDVPIYCIHGAGDNVYPYQQTQAFIDTSKLVGSVIVFDLVSGLNHNNACDYDNAIKTGAAYVKDNFWN